MNLKHFQNQNEVLKYQNQSFLGHMYVLMHIYEYVCAYMCMYVYVCMYIYTHKWNIQ
jgi:hypothetical protein